MRSHLNRFCNFFNLDGLSLSTVDECYIIYIVKQSLSILCAGIVKTSKFGFRSSAKHSNKEKKNHIIPFFVERLR